MTLPMQFETVADLCKAPQQEINLFAFMLTGHHEPDPGTAQSHSGIAGMGGYNPPVQQVLCDLCGGKLVTYEDRHDMSLAAKRVKPQCLDLTTEIKRVFQCLFPPPGLSFGDVDCLGYTGSNGWWQGCRENVGSGRDAQEIYDLLITSDIAADPTECLGERAHLQIDGG